MSEINYTERDNKLRSTLHDRVEQFIFKGKDSVKGINFNFLRVDNHNIKVLKVDGGKPTVTNLIKEGKQESNFQTFKGLSDVDKLITGFISESAVDVEAVKKFIKELESDIDRFKKDIKKDEEFLKTISHLENWVKQPYIDDIKLYTGMIKDKEGHIKSLKKRFGI